MTDRLERLSEDLIEQHMPLALEVLAASSRLGLPLGWHHVLDLVWLLRELDQPPGATVLDAGAGWGLARFLRADRGYRVVSVDMSARAPSSPCSKPRSGGRVTSTAGCPGPTSTGRRPACRVRVEPGLPARRDRASATRA